MLRGYETKAENLNSRPPPVQLSRTVFSKKLWIKCPDDVITGIFNAPICRQQFFSLFSKPSLKASMFQMIECIPKTIN